MNKELIKKRFSRKLDSYNANARIQKSMAEKLVNCVINAKSEQKKSILEIGCGTGFLTKLVVESINCEKYVALDIVPECEKYIKEINSDITFIPKDIEEYLEGAKEKFDLIISNASLQWIDNLPNFITKLVQKLAAGGILAFSTFGAENFREIYYVLGKTLPYLTKKELEEKLSEYKPIIEDEVRILAFKTPKEVLKHIQNTGVNALTQEIWTKKDLINFENGYNNFCASHPTLTYNPIYIKIQK